MLAGADKWFFPFESAERRILDGSGSALVNDVSGTFAAFLVRPEVNLTFHLYQGLSATLALFAMDYSPAFSDFVNDSVRYVIRYQVGGGFGYEF